jgi:hypothetical protein
MLAFVCIPFNYTYLSFIHLFFSFNFTIMFVYFLHPVLYALYLFQILLQLPKLFTLI